MKKKITRWLLIAVLILLVLLVVLYFAIQMPFVQNYAKDKILSSISEQYKADWRIGDVKIDFFDEVVAQDILFLDQHNDTLLAADRLLIDISLFSLIAKEINIDEVQIQGLRTKIYELDHGVMNFDFLISDNEDSSQTDSQQATSEGWTFSVDRVDLVQPSFYYATASQRISADVDDLVLDINTLDLDSQKVDLSLFQIINGDVEMESLSNTQSNEPFSLPQLGWDIQLDMLDVQQSSFNVVSDTPISVLDITVDITDVRYADTQFDLDIQQINAEVQDLFTIKNSRGNVSLSGADVSISNFIIDTERDRLRAESLKYNINTQYAEFEGLISDISALSLKQFQSFIPNGINLIKNTNLSLQAQNLSYSRDKLITKGIVLSYGRAIDLRSNLTIGNLDKSNLQITGNISSLRSDLLLLDRMIDGFSIPDSLSQFRRLDVSGAVDGTLSELRVNRLDIKLDDVFSANISGIIKHLDNLDQLEIEAQFQDMIADIQQLPIPSNEDVALDSLGKIKFDGRIVGNLQTMSIDGSFQSELGDLATDITLSNLDDIDNLIYKGDLSMNKFEIGTLFRNPNLNKITIATELDGQGIDFSKIDTKLKGRISDFAFNGYDYADVIINADVSDSKINGQLSIDDKNVKLSYDGIISFLDGQSIYKFEADIDTLNLQALGFYGKEVSVSGQLKSDFKLPLRQGSDGSVNLYHLRISNPNESFYEDSLLMMAAKRSDSTFIDIRSDFMSFDIDGQFGIRDLPNAFMSLADHYINLDTSMVSTELLSQTASIKGQLKTLLPMDVLLVDKLVQARNISFDFDFDFEQHSGEGKLIADSLYYDKYFSENMTLNMSTQSEVLSVDILGNNNDANGIDVPVFSLSNELRDRKLYSTLLAKDDDALPKLKFSAVIENTDDALQISLKDSLVLNRKDWTANKDNLIKLSDGKVIINELSFTDQNEYLKIYSTDENGNDLSVDFKNFNIGQFTTLLTNEPTKLSGYIDGEIEIKDISSDMFFLVNAVVDDIVYDSTSVGALTVVANDNPTTNVVNAELRLQGPQNDLVGKGSYNTVSRATDFLLDIDNFQLMLLDPFLSEIIKDSKGSLSGNASLRGTIDQPIIGGEVTLDKSITTIVVNNARYATDNHTITFDNEAIDIGVLDLYDANNNAATISGKIYHNFLNDIRLDLELDTDKFVFLNTSKDDNPIFFGKLVLDASGTIVGPISLLDVDLKAKTLENTLVTLSPLSGSTFAIEEEFITYGKPDEYEDQTSEYLLKLARAFPFKVNLLLNATNDATLNFVLDPVSGDRIEGKGMGDLRVKLNPDGQQEIYGTYTVNDGSYKFSYGDFVTKKFKIKPGGTVRFNGDPLRAVLDIDAIYNVYTTTYELIKNEISNNGSDMSSAEISAAQKRTNVEVYLSLEGSLISPKIKLDLQVPDLESSTLFSSIDQKLNELRNDPNEMNSQVFGLLIFDGFILSDNASTGFSSIGSNFALSSISNLISTQLNKFADKAIKGVDVNVNVNSYESSYANDGAGGNITEIGLEVSKRLFNDRLKISAGGNFDLSENGGAESYSSFIGDFVLEYKLSENGNYRVRVFSKSNFDRIANENSNKNGVSLYFNKTFDSKTVSKK